MRSSSLEPRPKLHEAYLDRVLKSKNVTFENLLRLCKFLGSIPVPDFSFNSFYLEIENWILVSSQHIRIDTLLFMIHQKLQTVKNSFLTSQIVLRDLNNGFSLSVDSETSTLRFILFSIYCNFVMFAAFESKLIDSNQYEMQFS